MSTFELFRDADQDLCFRLRTSDGMVLLTSEGFENKAEAEEAVERARLLAPEARSYERSYSDDGHGFTLQTYEGDVVATSGIFASASERDKAIEVVKDEALDAEVIGHDR